MFVNRRRFVVLFFSILLFSILPRCGGGGSSGTSVDFNGGSWESDFFLEDIYFGRPLFAEDGVAERLVNPASYIEVHPLTGQLLDGFPKLLFTGDDIENLYSLSLVDTSSQPFEAKVVPRNAGLILDFSQGVDLASLLLDGENRLTGDSPIRLYTRGGASVPIQVTVLEEDKLLFNPVTSDNVGFPPSPVNYDMKGVPVGLPDGFVKIALHSMGTGPSVLRSIEGLELGARFDLLGTPMHPVGFNPGNRVMDFVSFEDFTFNGSLPDLTPPRLIREVKAEGTVTGYTGATLTDSSATFNTTANSGSGAWSEALVTIRPGLADEESVRVASNGTDWLLLKTPFQVPPVVGVDRYLVRRAEYFEPIPGFERLETAIDPVNHPKDPDDPQDANNWKLIYFLRFAEWTGSGWDPVEKYPYGEDPDNPIDPTWRISMQFSEPMEIASFRPYETFYAAEDIGDIMDPLYDTMKLGRSAGQAGHCVISFEPVHRDQFGLMGGDTFRGFGKSAKDLRFVLRIVPPQAQVEAFYLSLGDPGTWLPEWGVVEDLHAEGVLGVFDLGGQPLALPEQFFDKGDPFCLINSTSPGRGAFPPAVDFLLNLSTSEDPDLEEFGNVVHRFKGLPETAADPARDETGVVFRDHDDGDESHGDNELYGPHIADIGIGLSGFLSGHPVEFIEHLFDDYNPPPPQPPRDDDPISRAPFGVGTPVNASAGARFQQVYRRGEASPDVQALPGTIWDIIGMAWAPIGGNVTNTTIKEMSIAMALCSLEIDLTHRKYTYDEPNTHEAGGIPDRPWSGLGRKFDEDRRPAGGNPNIENGNVFNTDGDGRLRDEWVVVLGDTPDEDNIRWNEDNYSGIVQGSVTGKPYADGRTYVIDQRNVFVPKNQGSNYNRYISYPEFDNPVEHRGFGYDSSRGLLIDIRTDHNGGARVSLRNGYAFHVGIQSSMLPRFRAYARAPIAARTRIFAATDPYDLLNPPTNMGIPDDNNSWIHGWDTMLQWPAEFGDNCRYFALFNYAKRISTIVSPLLRVRPATLDTPIYLSPVVDPPPYAVPAGTSLTMHFRSSRDAEGTVVSDWVAPEDIDLLNDGQARPYIQFRAVFEANLDTGEIPLLDTVVIPFRVEEEP